MKIKKMAANDIERMVVDIILPYKLSLKISNNYFVKFTLLTRAILVYAYARPPSKFTVNSPELNSKHTLKDYDTSVKRR
jgi:hypothetical protein